MTTSDVLQMLASGITVGAIYALLALGFVTIFRSSKVVNFAQGDLAMVGGLGTAYMLKTLGLPYPIAAVLAVVLVTVIGIAMYQLIIAPLGRASVISMVLVTMGAAMFLQNGTLLTYGANPSSLPGFTGDSPIKMGGVAILPQSLWILLMAVVVVVILYLFGSRTLMGKAMTATSTNLVAANLVGISTGAMVRWSFAISASIGALAGIFLAPMVPLNYFSGSILGIKGITALTVGGWGMAIGAITGGLVLGIVESFGAGLLPSGYKDAISFGVLMLILYVRPSGIFKSSQAGELKLD